MNVQIMKEEDLPQILSIYNEGIEDKIATLEEDVKDLPYIIIKLKEGESFKQELQRAGIQENQIFQM